MSLHLVVVTDLLLEAEHCEPRVFFPCVTRLHTLTQNELYLFLAANCIVLIVLCLLIVQEELKRLVLVNGHWPDLRRVLLGAYDKRLPVWSHVAIWKRVFHLAAWLQTMFEIPLVYLVIWNYDLQWSVKASASTTSILALEAKVRLVVVARGPWVHPLPHWVFIHPAPYVNIDGRILL